MNIRHENILAWVICAIIGLCMGIITQHLTTSYSSTPDNVSEKTTSTQFQNYIEQNQEYLIQIIEREKQGGYKTQIIYRDQDSQMSKIDIEVKYDYIQITDKYGIRAKVPLMK